MHPSEPEAVKLTSVTSAPAEPPRKKKKGPKGPNPLSMKKKKPKLSATVPKQLGDSVAQAGEKRKRHDVDDDSTAHKLEGSGHKRKRRRKHAGQSDATNDQDAGSES